MTIDEPKKKYYTMILNVKYDSSNRNNLALLYLALLSKMNRVSLATGLVAAECDLSYGAVTVCLTVLLAITVSLPRV